MTDLKSRLKDMFAHVFEKPYLDEAVIQKYFHSDYIQSVDGKFLDFEQFVKHIKVLHEKVINIKINFKSLVQEENIICSIHIAQGVKKSGQQVKTKIIAVFKFDQDKIISCEELTHLIQGDSEDRNLGSIH